MDKNLTNIVKNAEKDSFNISPNMVYPRLLILLPAWKKFHTHFSPWCAQPLFDAHMFHVLSTSCVSILKIQKKGAEVWLPRLLHHMHDFYPKTFLRVSMNTFISLKNISRALCSLGCIFGWNPVCSKRYQFGALKSRSYLGELETLLVKGC